MHYYKVETPSWCISKIFPCWIHLHESIVNVTYHDAAQSLKVLLILLISVYTGNYFNLKVCHKTSINSGVNSVPGICIAVIKDKWQPTAFLPWFTIHSLLHVIYNYREQQWFHESHPSLFPTMRTHYIFPQSISSREVFLKPKNSSLFFSTVSLFHKSRKLQTILVYLQCSNTK